MDAEAEITVSLSGNKMKNSTVSDCSFCCSNKSMSSSGTNVSSCEIESSTKCPTMEKDCLRQDTINALAWATCRAFKYRPSDPIHYLVHQLLRWRYGDIARGNTTESNLCEDTCIDELSRKVILPRDD